MAPDLTPEPAVDRLLAARARTLHDLAARGLADVYGVSILEEAVSARRWWVAQWAAGADFVDGLVAQDVQDALFDVGTRWPRCTVCDTALEHSLTLQPDLDPDPRWVCTESGTVVAALGRLDDTRR